MKTRIVVKSSIKEINVSQAMIDGMRLINADSQLPDSTKKTIQNLLDVVTHLSNRLGVNSSNSSKPPSQDPNRFRKKTQSKGIKRKPGAQPGHKGTTLKKVEEPNEIQEISVDRRTVPHSFYKTVGYESRQVFDINLTLNVTEFRAEIIENQEGECYVADFPEGVTQAAQYGSYTKATSVYLSQAQLVPLDRVRDYFQDQAGIPVSKGSISNFNTEAYKRLEDFEEWAKKQLIASPLNHADETGINVDGKKRWLHCLSNLKVTLFHPDEKRGKDAMDRMGVLPSFSGILCHDHWKPYFKYDCSHSLCNAHHLRELEWCFEFENQTWAEKMKTLLIEINDDKSKTGFVTNENQSKFQERYRAILSDGERECPVIKKLEVKRGRTKKTKSRNLLERLQNFEKETLRFMREPRVPFTNNQGENDIRMTKVQQKISGCFRSMDGARQFCRIRSYLSTCRKNGFSPTEALRLLFEGKLPTFII